MWRKRFRDLSPSHSWRAVAGDSARANTYGARTGTPSTAISQSRRLFRLAAGSRANSSEYSDARVKPVQPAHVSSRTAVRGCENVLPATPEWPRLMESRPTSAKPHLLSSLSKVFSRALFRTVHHRLTLSVSCFIKLAYACSLQSSHPILPSATVFCVLAARAARDIDGDLILYLLHLCCACDSSSVPPNSQRR